MSPCRLCAYKRMCLFIGACVYIWLQDLSQQTPSVSVQQAAAYVTLAQEGKDI